MTHEDLERARREFMQGKRSAASYWDCFHAYWSQFRKVEKSDNTTQCLCCKNCLPPYERIGGKMCRLQECKYEPA